ncbi:unnamed protein product [Cuscuta europaea]|uniref:Uncharacterized protein n=1 Tax=Cuscuta europaea TaxID=41803 RepID=A0A9P0Z8P0_CUSEU|nr:unnamed protein product [Cuscuta europaea]
MLEAKLETRARGAALKYILYIYFENSGKEGAGTGCPDKPRPAI